MKSELEVQRAHDMLAAIIENHIPNDLSPDRRRTVVTCAIVLCWVLDHTHNQVFGEMLARTEQLAAEKGYVLERRQN